MKIGEVSKKTGIPASTLRYYEEIGLIEPPPRVSGQRAYDDSVFEVLRVIQSAQASGFSLKEIQAMLDEDDGKPIATRWREIAERKLTEVQQTIAEYEAMRDSLMLGVACECTSLDDCAVYC